MSVNQKQIGGTHYKSKYEHWDLVIFCSMNYLEGCSTKYVTRWRRAKGIQDLQKAQHYLEKLIDAHEIYDISDNRPRPERAAEEIDKFAKANGLTPDERNFIYQLSTFKDMEDLLMALAILRLIITDAETHEFTRSRAEPNYPGTPEDGGHYDP